MVISTLVFLLFKLARLVMLYVKKNCDIFPILLELSLCHMNNTCDLDICDSRWLSVVLNSTMFQDWTLVMSQATCVTLTNNMQCMCAASGWLVLLSYHFKPIYPVGTSWDSSKAYQKDIQTHTSIILTKKMRSIAYYSASRLVQWIYKLAEPAKKRLFFIIFILRYLITIWMFHLDSIIVSLYRIPHLSVENMGYNMLLSHDLSHVLAPMVLHSPAQFYDVLFYKSHYRWYCRRYVFIGCLVTGAMVCSLLLWDCFMRVCSLSVYHRCQ